MNLNDRILVLENRIIDFFTMLTWWGEVRFDITNVRLAITISTLSSLFGFTTFLVILQDVYEKKQWVFVFVSTVLASFLAIGFLIKVLAREVFEKGILTHNPQGSPNPCRISGYHSMIRRMETGTTLLLFISLDEKVSIIFFLLYCFCKTLTSFLLACDSIPPEEKQRRRKLSEINSLNLEPGGI